MAKKPVGSLSLPENQSSRIGESIVISVSQALAVTEVEPASRNKGINESSDTGGSVFHGVRVLKFGEYAGKRTWKALIESNHLAFLGSTEKIDKIWTGISFSGKTYSGKTRNDICKLLTEEFLAALGISI